MNQQTINYDLLRLSLGTNKQMTNELMNLTRHFLPVIHTSVFCKGSDN